METVCLDLDNGELRFVVSLFQKCSVYKTSYSNSMKILSIINYDVKSGQVTLKLINGEVIIATPKVDRSIIYSNYRNTKAFESDITYMYSGFLHFSDICLSSMAIKIKDISDTSVDNMYRAILTDGSLFDFKIDGAWGSIAMCSEDKSIWLDCEDLYCIKGKMKLSKIVESVTVGEVLLIKAENGSYYAFKNYSGGYSYLYVLDNFALIIYEMCEKYIGERIENFTDTCKSLTVFKNGVFFIYDTEVILKPTAEILEIAKKIPKDTLYYINVEKWEVEPNINVFDVSHAKYYSADNGDIIKLAGSMQHCIEYHGSYYKDLSEALMVFPHKFPLKSTKIRQCRQIQHLSNNIIINKLYPLTSEPAAKITNIRYDPIFTPYDYIFELGTQRRGCFAGSNFEYIVFEDGEVWPTMGEEGKYYSLAGPYAPIKEYTKIKNHLYEINGNLVVFMEFPTCTDIYESFGEYLGVCNNEQCPGIIVVNRRSNVTKPASV